MPIFAYYLFVAVFMTSAPLLGRVILGSKWGMRIGKWQNAVVTVLLTGFLLIGYGGLIIDNGCNPYYDFSSNGNEGSLVHPCEELPISIFVALLLAVPLLVLSAISTTVLRRRDAATSKIG